MDTQRKEAASFLTDEEVAELIKRKRSEYAELKAQVESALGTAVKLTEVYHKGTGNRNTGKVATLAGRVVKELDEILKLMS